MIPVNQFILGGSDPLLYPSEKMTNSIDEQIAFLQSQKQAINEAYRRNFNFDIPFIGDGNISKGIISLEVPYVNKIVALNQTDLEVLKESLISLKTK